MNPFNINFKMYKKCFVFFIDCVPHFFIKYFYFKWVGRLQRVDEVFRDIASWGESVVPTTFQFRQDDETTWRWKPQRFQNVGITQTHLSSIFLNCLLSHLYLLMMIWSAEIYIGSVNCVFFLYLTQWIT
jgi:hypothetical protein